MLVDPNYLVTLVEIDAAAVRLFLAWMRSQQRAGYKIPDHMFKVMEQKYPEFGQEILELRQVNCHKYIPIP